MYECMLMNYVINIGDFTVEGLSNLLNEGLI